MRVVIYARRSPDEAAAAAVQNQLAVLRNHCATQAGWQIVGEVVDEGERGSDFTRPGIQRITELAQAGEIDAIIATTQDRYHREGYLFEGWLRDVLRPAGVMPYTLTGALSDETPMHWQARQAESTYAETHARISGYKARLGVRAKLQRGEYAKRMLLGYQRGEGGALVADPHWWPVIAEIFERRAAGDPFLGIARDFNERGLLTPTGKRWSEARIRHLVVTREYSGVLTLGGEIVKGPDGEPVRGKISPVIPPNVWQLAQPRGWTGRPPKFVYLLSGLLVCPQWRVVYPPEDRGQPMHYVGSNRQYYAVNKETRIAEPVAGDPLAEHVRAYFDAEWLEGVVLDTLEANAHRVDDLLVNAAELGGEQLIASLRERRQSVMHQLAECETALRQCQDDQLKAVRMEAASVIKRLERDEAQLREQADDLAGQLSEIDSQLSSQHDPPRPNASEQINLISEARAFDSRRDLRELLRGILSAVEIKLVELADTYEVDVVLKYTHAEEYIYLLLTAVSHYRRTQSRKG